MPEVTSTSSSKKPASDFPDGTAVPACGEFKSDLTSGQLQEIIDHAAAFLAEAGVLVGDVVALAFPNSVESWILVKAVSQCEARGFPLDSAYSVEEFESCFLELKPKLLLTPQEGNQPAQSAASKLNIPHLTAKLHSGDSKITFSSTGIVSNLDSKFEVGKLTEEFGKLSGLKEFSYEELMTATDRFNNDKILGKGGSGVVYEGHIGDSCTKVAVKMINPDPAGGRKEYISEVETLSQLRHKNLVQLLGYCHEANKLVLVYEFMRRGSLEHNLFGGQILLPWKMRYSIARGLALALYYMHEQCHRCVIHRDIKSSNIMLDENFNAKLGDFGLARLVDHARGLKTTEKMGTWGYAAPEYIETGKASKESDVYSFGVVLLEITCGRRVIDLARDQQGLVEWVWKQYEDGKLHKAVDSRLNKSFDREQAKALMVAGLWCAHPNVRFRPSIEAAMDVLNLKAPLPKLPRKMPRYQRIIDPKLSSRR